MMSCTQFMEEINMIKCFGTVRTSSPLDSYIASSTEQTTESKTQSNSSKGLSVPSDPETRNGPRIKEIKRRYMMMMGTI